MELPPLRITVLDTETTGFLPRVHRIIEFASVRTENGSIVDEYEQLLGIGQDLPPEIMALTHIRTEDLQGKPSMEDVRDTLKEHIGEDTIIVGQNIAYDIGMLKGEGIDLSSHPTIDTSALASLVFPSFESYSLGYVSRVLNLTHEPKHRARGDVRATLELLSQCWERLLDLPADLQEQAQDYTKRGGEGYRLLFEALPPSKSKKRPTWLKKERPLAVRPSQQKTVMPKAPVGTVALVEEPPQPHVLQEVVNAAVNDPSTMHWIAVKNLDASVERLAMNTDDVRVLYPSNALLSPEEFTTFLSQKSFTDSEVILVLKLLWYAPRTTKEIPLHGEDYSIWNGKLACSDDSLTYIDQFKDLPTVVLLDHRQLLSFLADPKHTAHGALKKDAHIIVDDASMLEDTATKACGWHCSFNDLRAAAEGNEALTKALDVTQLWIERIRQAQDVRYLTPADLRTPDVRGLREQLEPLVATAAFPASIRQQLAALVKILKPENLEHNIVYIEQRIDGSQFLHSVPERIGVFLQQQLYGGYATTLLIPPGSSDRLPEIIPSGTPTSVDASLYESALPPFHLAFDGEQGLGAFLQNLPEGKSILLVPSKRLISDLFVRHAARLEAAGVSLFCQGLSGGIGRTRAAFIAAQEPAVWALTPWSYEGTVLPDESVDRLVIAALPFDHPSHAVLSKRAEHYRNPFEEYALPRTLHRLFRLLRTFSDHCVHDAEVLVLDERIEKKGYGKVVWEYLKNLSN